jgi:hypothetical protein
MWTARCWHATGTRKARGAGITPGDTEGAVITRWWRCWPKAILFSMHGCAQAMRRPIAMRLAFLSEAFALAEQSGVPIKRLRADCGYYGQDLLEWLEERSVGYLIIARQTQPVLRSHGEVEDGVASSFAQDGATDEDLAANSINESPSSTPSCVGLPQLRRFSKLPAPINPILPPLSAVQKRFSGWMVDVAPAPMGAGFHSRT